MNYRTDNIFKEAKELISDECVFSPDQITLLVNMIDKIGSAGVTGYAIQTLPI